MSAAETPRGPDGDGASGSRSPWSRHRPSGLESVLADRLAFLRAEDWDAVTAHAPVFARREFLSVLADHPPPGVLQRYALVYRGPAPVAAVVSQTVDMKASQLVESPADLSEEERGQLSMKSLTTRALEKVERRVQMCGNLATWGAHGALFREGEDPGDLWPAVSETLYRLRRADRLHGDVDYVMVKELSEEESAAAAPLERFGYRPLEIEPNMVLELDPDWGSFDDYLAALNKKYRKAARTSLKGIEDAGAAVAPLADLDAHAPRLHELYRAVASRGTFRVMQLPEGFFPALARSLGPERFAAPAVTRGEEILGYVTMLRDGETAHAYYVGVDYAANAELPVYHRLLFAAIEQGIAWGCRRVSYGGTALDAKARLGCTPVRTFVHVRHRTPPLNLLVRRLLRAIPPPEAPPRNPFKSPRG